MWTKAKDGTLINLNLIQSINIHERSVIYTCIFHTDEEAGYYEENFETIEEAQKRLSFIEGALATNCIKTFAL